MIYCAAFGKIFCGTQRVVPSGHNSVIFLSCLLMHASNYTLINKADCINKNRLKCCDYLCYTCKRALPKKDHI